MSVAIISFTTLKFGRLTRRKTRKLGIRIHSKMFLYCGAGNIFLWFFTILVFCQTVATLLNELQRGWRGNVLCHSGSVLLNINGMGLRRGHWVAGKVTADRVKAVWEQLCKIEVRFFGTTWQRNKVFGWQLLTTSLRMPRLIMLKASVIDWLITRRLALWRRGVWLKFKGPQGAIVHCPNSSTAQISNDPGLRKKGTPSRIHLHISCTKYRYASNFSETEM